MIFGDVALDQAVGAILAHSLKLFDRRLAKGHVLGDDDIAALRAAGHRSVIAARLEPGDMEENAAASTLAGAIRADHLRLSIAATGRVNVFATVNGLFIASKSVVDCFNRIDPAITLATLADHVRVSVGDMVATIKIIPFGVAQEAVEAGVSLLAGQAPFTVKAFCPHRVGLIATELPSLKSTIMDKTRAILDQRLALSDSLVATEIRLPHRAAPLAKTIMQMGQDHQLLVIFGASAIVDPNDVIPEAIRLAGGSVIAVGLPVDPGNLLVFGKIGEVYIIGAPGCARSPKENGFDWVLARILAGEHPDRDMLTGFGVGGLLMEIPTRPRPRMLETRQAAQIKVGAIILAAGAASRMTGYHKLLAEFDGAPLVRRSVQTVLASGFDHQVIVTGHRQKDIMAAISQISIDAVHNQNFATGMASSLRLGLKALAGKVDGVMVVLADMPGLMPADLAAIIAAFKAHDGKAIIRAVADGKRGNPVILPRATFAAIERLQGDIGARPIIEKSGLEIIDIDIGEAAHLDVDTHDAILAAGGILRD